MFKGKMYSVLKNMHLLIFADQVDAILSFQTGICLKIFEQAPTGCASILLGGHNGAIVGSLLHSNRFRC